VNKTKQSRGEMCAKCANLSSYLSFPPSLPTCSLVAVVYPFNWLPIPPSPPPYLPPSLPPYLFLGAMVY